MASGQEDTPGADTEWPPMVNGCVLLTLATGSPAKLMLDMEIYKAKIPNVRFIFVDILIGLER